MARTEIGKYLAIDTRVCGGRLIFKGTRIAVFDAIELVRDGYTPEEVADQYYGLITAEAVREALSLVRRKIVKEISVRAKPARARAAA
jgi:uncharacterized protein (DUF433 family)